MLNRPNGKISIHALLAESDESKLTYYSPSPNFYPRSPCGERPEGSICFDSSELFLSTLSLRRATSLAGPSGPAFLYFYPRSPCGERHKTPKLIFNVRYFYPRSPCGERLVGASQGADFEHISIHALLAESDCRNSQNIKRGHTFLSTLSLRRATLAPKQNATEQRNFYPRSPCGERLGGNV